MTINGVHEWSRMSLKWPISPSLCSLSPWACLGLLFRRISKNSYLNLFFSIKYLRILFGGIFKFSKIYFPFGFTPFKHFESSNLKKLCKPKVSINIVESFKTHKSNMEFQMLKKKKRKKRRRRKEFQMFHYW